MLISTFETIFLLSSPICQQMILLCHIYFLGNIPSDGVVLLADDALSHVCDFPTSFHLPSRRSIRRRLLTQSAGFPHPDPVTAAQSRRKRKLAMAAKSSREINSTTEMIEHRTHIHVLQRNVRQRTGLSQSSTLVPINSGHTQPFATVDGACSSSTSSALLSPSPTHQHHLLINSRGFADVNLMLDM
jgi:hypothetical protein